jgi:hypothetical protein
MHPYQLTEKTLGPFMTPKIAAAAVGVALVGSLATVTANVHWSYYVLVFIAMVFTGSAGILWNWNGTIHDEGRAPFAVYQAVSRTALLTLLYTLLWTLFAVEGVFLKIVITLGVAYAGYTLLRKLAFYGFPDDDPVVVEPDPWSGSLYAWEESLYIATLETYSLEQAREA